MSKTRVHFQNLDELAPLIRITDGVLIEVLAKRGKLAGLVGDYKDLHGDEKIRKEVEVRRMDEAGAYAKKIGVDPDFARSMILHAIAESCRIQIMQTDAKHVSKQLEWIDDDVNKWLVHLRENLIKLTELVAPIYETDLYGPGASVATSMYVEYEWDQIRHEIENLRPRGPLNLALDLGCATGRLTRQLSAYFRKVIGYDLSPHMLEVAKARPLIDNQGEIVYTLADIEEGMKDIPSESVNLVIMTVGTASDFYDLRRVLTSVNRVLAPHGRFVLSFYNKSALMYQLFVPWPLSLQAMVNIEKNYLEVTVGEQTFPVFARLYDTGQVKQLLAKARLKVSRMLTYPTLGSIFPNPVLRQKLAIHKEGEVVALMKDIDQKLSSEAMGAYVIVTGSKPGSLTKK
ncbi:MAG: methyltransferase domain-containing protein [bacterium]|nr:methyltransferase domain-containing protein [bacterium]